MTEKRATVRMPAASTDRVFRVEVRGREWAPHRDFYHWMLTMPWSWFFGFVAVVYVTVNAAFAVSVLARPGCVTGIESFGDAFAFSVQTIATIGYGGMVPASRYGHLIVATESLVGIVGTALVTGMTFAKFARPSARVLFASRCVVTPRDGVPHLVFRMANFRHNTIVEAQLRVILLVEERTREGEMMRMPVELPLVRDRTALFSLSWSAMHRIDEASPLFGPDALDRLRAVKGELFLSLAGLDATTATTIHARQYYTLDDIVWNARFADVLSINEDGTRVIDYTRFHDTVPIEA